MIQPISKGLECRPQTVTQLGEDWEEQPHCWCSVSIVAWKPSSRTAPTGVGNVPPSCRKHLQLIQQVSLSETASTLAQTLPTKGHQPGRCGWQSVNVCRWL